MKYIDADKLKSLIKDQIKERNEWLKDINMSDRQDQLWTDLNGEDMSILQIINALPPERWNPSEEQLEALKWSLESLNFSARRAVIESLYDDLKKLL